MSHSPARRPSRLPAAAACGVALWHAARLTGLDAVAAPGLWPLAARLGLAEAVTPLFAIVAAGAIVTALVQPMAHGSRDRPWPAALTVALLIPLLLLPMPATVLVAALPVAIAAGVGRAVAIATAAAVIAPPVGAIALGLAAWRMGLRLSLPDAANDNPAEWPYRAGPALAPSIPSPKPAPRGSRRPARG